MEHYTYKTKGTCSRAISFDSDGQRVYNVKFFMGCPGNTLGISALAEGMLISELVEKFENIDCGGRGTSCPAQLAIAVKNAKKI